MIAHAFYSKMDEESNDFVSGIPRREIIYVPTIGVWAYTGNEIDYFREGVKFSHYSEARFKVRKVELRNNFFSDVKNFHKRIIKYIPFKKFLNIFFWNIFSEIYYELEVVK